MSHSNVHNHGASMKTRVFFFLGRTFIELKTAVLVQLIASDVARLCYCTGMYGSLGDIDGLIAVDVCRQSEDPGWEGVTARNLFRGVHGFIQVQY